MSGMTYKGEEYMLIGDGSSDGSLARLATKAKLYLSTSTPAKDGTGFNEVANGNGYATGGQAITVANWTYSSNPSRIVLDDLVWTAAGGQIVDIAGAYLTDASDTVLAWFSRSTPVTLDDGDTITLTSLTVRIP